MKSLKTSEAAQRIGVSAYTVRDYARRGLLSTRTTNGVNGPGQTLFFDPAEVDAFAEGGAPAAEQYRKSKTTPRPLRGRKRS